MKMVLNRCYGGFNLSEEARKMLHKDVFDYDEYTNRTDAELVSVVENLGEKANGMHSRLKVVEIPDTFTDWEITDYDGVESVIYVIDGKIHRC